jgi:uncharacterized protein YjbI with pentapeptide repeats
MNWVTFAMIIGMIGMVTFGLLCLLLAETFLRTRKKAIRTAQGLNVPSSAVTAEERAFLTATGEIMIMASKEHLQRLIAAISPLSISSWNQWRMENPNVRPNLRGVELPGVNLSFANLSHADLSHADLRGTNFHSANLQHTDLSSTSLEKADLSEADLSYALLKAANLRSAILRNTNLHGTNLIGASLNDVDFRGADFTDALIDTEALKQPKKWFGGGISQLEKLALGLFARAQRKDRPSLDAGTKPPRSDKHV